MYLTLLEYLLVRVAFGAVLVVFRAAGVVIVGAVWVLGAVLRLVLRPLAREVARAIGRLVGQVQLAAARRRARALDTAA